MVAHYGPVVYAKDGKLYLKYRSDGSCVFLEPTPFGTFRCRIYHERPLACRMYPLFVTDEPLRRSDADEALYLVKRGGRTYALYVYVDKMCPGVDRPDGEPIEKFVKYVVDDWLKTVKLSRYFTYPL